MAGTIAPAKAEKKAAGGVQPGAGKEADIVKSLWAITGRGNNAEVRLRAGRLVVYKVKKHIAVG